MTDDTGSRDRSFEALDFIINVLKEHEKNLDRSIHNLATVTQQKGDTNILNGKVEIFEAKVNNLQKDVTTLISVLSNRLKEDLPTTGAKKKETQTIHALLPASIKEDSSMILYCRGWGDFEVLASKAQTLFFSYTEDNKLFQADALSGKQIITYVGPLPSFATILKTWLSQKLDITERNIIEGGINR
jgi:hypothetical protein